MTILNSQLTGNVLEIQRFSLHDGPGIRTTVFLKGCHLRCAWCHNPESMRLKPELMYFDENCAHCAACVAACREQVHEVQGDRHVVHFDRCAAGGACVAACSHGALKMAGRNMTVGEVMAEIEEDRAFYLPDGGVTLSGGEPLLQADFAAAILRACHGAGIPAAIETSLCYPWARLEPLLPFVDLIMFDIKMMDAQRHRQYTGHETRDRDANIERLGRAGKSVIARTPVIPGINDQPDEIARMADKIHALPGLLYYELLSYHPLGSAKYSALGQSAPAFSTPTSESMLQLARIAAGRGIAVRINGKRISE